MKTDKIIKFLREINSCTEAIEWVKENKFLSFQNAWNECHRADWLLWFAAKVGMINRRKKIIVSLACDFAEDVITYVPKEETRPREAIKAAREWIACGNKDNAAAAPAAPAAYAAYAAYAAAAAAYAAYAAAPAAPAAPAAAAAAYAAYAAYAAAAAAYAADAADAAADAAAAAAADDDDDVKKEKLRIYANLVREKLTCPKIMK